LSDLARRTYQQRSSVHEPDWSFDPLHAARLGLGEEVGKNLIAVTKAYQTYSSGLASWNGKPGQEPYIEQSGVLAATVAEAVAQDYDGLLRIAPALPSDWDADGTVFIQHRSTVHLQVRHGVPSTVVVDAGANYQLQMRNPWPTQSVMALDGTGGGVLGETTADILTFGVREGSSYLIQRVDQPVIALPFAPVTGMPASAARHLTEVKIGLDPNVASTGP
jgi:hypothetical protein